MDEPDLFDLCRSGWLHQETGGNQCEQAHQEFIGWTCRESGGANTHTSK